MFHLPAPTEKRGGLVGEGQIQMEYTEFRGH